MDLVALQAHIIWYTGCYYFYAKNLGSTSADGVVTPKLFKALLTMDAYVLVNNGSEKLEVSNNG